MAQVRERRRMFSLEERARRYAAIRREMAEQGLDVLLMVARDGHGSRGDLRYIAGYGPLVPTPHYAVFPLTQAEPVFLANSRNRGRVAHESGWVNEVRAGWVGLEDQILAEIGRFADAGAIGVARFATLPVPLYLELAGRFGADRVRDAAPLLDKVRSRKGEEEIECAREAGRIADAGYEVLRERVKPGVSDCEFFAEARRVMHAMGSEYSMDLVGADGAGVFAPADRLVDANGFVEGELTPTYLGMYNQLPFDFAFGKAAVDRRPAMEALHGAYDAMMAEIRPGLRVPELYEVGRKMIEESGFTAAAGQFGHALGLDAIDGFSILPEHDVTLAAGMMFVLHPILTTPAQTRVLLGSTLVVTEDGAESMNSADVWWERWS